MSARTHSAILAGFLFVGVCYGLEVLEIREPVVDIKPYMNTDDTYINEPESVNIGFESRPLKSKATPGTVHSSDAPPYINTPIVILGDDDESRQWIAQHAHYLNAFHGLGLVANATNPEHVQELEEVSGIPLVSVNVDALMDLLGQSHYPLVVEGGKVWQ